MSRNRLLIHLLCLLGTTLALLSFSAPQSIKAAPNQTDIAGPAGSAAFGQYVKVLPNGNFVISDPDYYVGAPSNNIGAVFLYDGKTFGLISTLTGSQAGDRVGRDGAVSVLTNGNYVVVSKDWHHGTSAGAGAVTWCSWTLGCSGAVSETNSLVGTQAGEFSSVGVYALSNGNYVVSDPDWQNGSLAKAGAVRWCNGSSGCTGPITTSNSLYGSQANDAVGNLLFTLGNGNYVVKSPFWHNGSLANAGAVTWCSGTSGCTGPVTAANSLVGSHADDRLSYYGRIDLLYPRASGNYLVESPNWHNGSLANAGAVTWCSGRSGCQGEVTPENSVVGSHADDQVGYSSNTALLPNGDYVIGAPLWDNGTVTDAGAARWCKGDGSCTGPLSPANSLVGTHAVDIVGQYVNVLYDSNYVVRSGSWSSDTTEDVGAVTWCSGSSGCIGPVSESNSLVGSHARDYVGLDNFYALPNGSYFVPSPGWDNGTILDAGAVTWCPANGGCTGAVTALNSLVGSHMNDLLGSIPGDFTGANTYMGRSYLLANGNYVIDSPGWDNGTISNAGAVTWCSDTGGCVGPVTAANSLVGSHNDDRVGYQSVAALSNGDYVVSSSLWGSQAQLGPGAITWCDGSSGCRGEVSASNSVIGPTAGVFPWDLGSGHFLATGASATIDGIANAGAVKWCTGAASCSGDFTSANSLMGSQADDHVESGGIRVLPDGSYVVLSPLWDDGTLTDSGAITWGDGANGTTVGPITEENSVLGGTAGGGQSMIFAYDAPTEKLIVGRPADRKVTILSRPTHTTHQYYIYLPLVTK